MKLVGIMIMSLGAFWGVKNYINSLKEQLLFLKDWAQIFWLWKEWILHYSYSTAELIERTVTDSTCGKSSVAKMMNGKSIDEIFAYVEKFPLSQDEKQIILKVLNDLGNSLTETEVQSLSRAVQTLETQISQREASLKEKTTLLYKLTPLLCAAAAILIW